VVSPRGFLERGRRSEETPERRPPRLPAYSRRDALLVVAGNRLPANLGNSGLLGILGGGLTAMRQGASTSPRAAMKRVESVYRKPGASSRGQAVSEVHVTDLTRIPEARNPPRGRALLGNDGRSRRALVLANIMEADGKYGTHATGRAVGELLRVRVSRLACARNLLA